MRWPSSVSRGKDGTVQGYNQLRRYLTAYKHVGYCCFLCALLYMKQFVTTTKCYKKPIVYTKMCSLLSSFQTHFCKLNTVEPLHVLGDTPKFSKKSAARVRSVTKQICFPWTIRTTFEKFCKRHNVAQKGFNCMLKDKTRRNYHRHYQAISLYGIMSK